MASHSRRIKENRILSIPEPFDNLPRPIRIVTSVNASKIPTIFQVAKDFYRDLRLAADIKVYMTQVQNASNDPTVT